MRVKVKVKVKKQERRSHGERNTVTGQKAEEVAHHVQKMWSCLLWDTCKILCGLRVWEIKADEVV